MWLFKPFNSHAVCLIHVRSDQSHQTFFLALGLAQGVYQCQTSSDQRGLVYTPNISDDYFNHVFAAAASSSTNGTPRLVEARDGFTYFFTLPPQSSAARNCSGTLVAIQFCYHAELRNNEDENLQDIFEFLVTDRQDLRFTFSRFRVQAASSETNCVVGQRNMMGPNTPHDCCTSFQPPNELQTIPSSSFTFGIRIFDRDFTPFVFRESVQEFRVEQFQTEAIGPEDSFITLGRESNVTDNALFLLRFLLGNCTTKKWLGLSLIWLGVKPLNTSTTLLEHDYHNYFRARCYAVGKIYMQL